MTQGEPALKSEDDWWVSLVRATAKAPHQHAALDAIVSRGRDQLAINSHVHNTRTARVMSQKKRVNTAMEGLEEMRGKNADKQREKRSKPKRGKW